MKGKQLALLAVLLFLVGGAALFLNQRQEATWSSRATTAGGKILDFPLNDVAQVTIKGAGAELNLAKKEDIWTVKERADYPADFTKVSSLLRKLWELQPVQDVKIGASQLGRLQLLESGADANSSTLVDLKSAGDKRLAALLLGKKHLRESDEPMGAPGGMATGRYVMLAEGAKSVFLISETLDEAQTKPEQWLSRDFIKVESPKLIAVKGPSPTTTWTLTRENASAPWQLTDAKPGETLDSAKASGTAGVLANPSFTDVLAADAPVAETGLDNPATVRVETFDGFVYELRIGKLMGENYPVMVSVNAELPKERTPAADEKPEDKAKLDQEFQTKQKQLTEKQAKEQKLPNRPYLMAKSTVDQLLKERTALLTPPPTPSPSPAPAAAAAPPAPPAPTAKTSPPKRPE